jgi:hypothetical protein
MKKLVRFALPSLALLLSEATFGQSNLPACRGTDVTRWNNCFGSWNDSNGDKYVGEFKNGQRNGQGIISDNNGKLKETGIYKDGTLFIWRYIDPNSFIRSASDSTTKTASDSSTKKVNKLQPSQRSENRRICSVWDGEDMETHRLISGVNYCDK